MGHLKLKILLLIANLIIPVSVILFTAGFLRHKPILPNPTGFESQQLASYGNFSEDAPFDKVVFMVVDALRSDFLYSSNSGFKFTQRLIRSGAAIPFTAQASPPTLTISRIKAMTTGSNPTFLDVFLNLADSEAASTLADEDTWLARLKAKGSGKLVFYGENTWLQLFPNTFDRSDGVSAFFVPDFTEVDNNVTRHIASELTKSDWSAMVLHFPGMDHVGHTGGPKSTHMLPKQREMDDIINQIYQAIEIEAHLKSTLLIVGGDHGMDERGNHGGSSPGEIASALVFMSPRLKDISDERECPTTAGAGDFDYYTVLQQSDIVPTLAGLLDFPVPTNNLGIFIPDFFPLWKKRGDHVQLLLQNGIQMMELFQARNPSFSVDRDFKDAMCTHYLSDRDELACLWQSVQNRLEATEWLNQDPEDILQIISTFCKRAQQVMGMTSSNFDIPLLSYGIVSALTAIVLSLYGYYSFGSLRNAAGLSFGAIIVFNGLIMFTNQYVEEEHHFWYWSSLAWLGYLSFSRSARSGLLVPALLVASQFLTHCWNQSSDAQYKVVGLVDIHIFQHYQLLWTLITASYAVTGMRLSAYLNAGFWGQKSFLNRPAAAFLCLIALLFKLGCTSRDNIELVDFVPLRLLLAVQQLDLALTAQVLFSGVLAGLLYMIIQLLDHTQRLKRGKSAMSELTCRKERLAGILELFTIYLMTQSRARNIPLFLIFRFQLDLLLSFPTKLNPLETSVTILVLAQSSFFAFGNSNSIASIDLSNGYNGVLGYQAAIVVMQVLLSNWAGPIWWACGGLKLLFNLIVVEQSPGNQNSTSLISQANTGNANGSVNESLLVENSNGKTTDRAGANTAGNGKTKKRAGPFFEYLLLQTLFTVSSLFTLMAAITFLREQPFIWTVHAPKYVFAGLWSLFFHLGINVFFCTLVWWTVL